jgi:hypothetical protein
MSYDSDNLEDQHRSVLKWLFDAAFGRREATPQEFGEKVSLLGTIRRLLGKD